MSTVYRLENLSQKHIDLLEKVQKRATHLMITEKGEKRKTKKLGITTLETSRLRGD